ncbi:GGDEF domain-containing protein [Pullulanibacillus sp. KACC 23026]|uniref:sensor domain-containing diguanylate cyclase n=1 Tax=Pullulanibacillus sp. KACC 23026 TaxID=3028315 RepID=UPI0023AEDAF6|nr:GGDEF domain-containing protein [Pullulanibacillus sp. KACC 23026]WEG14047.1 GGDEF domain-containing protein [Pullulanibacillus sp. KACC 23026]
MTEQSKRLMWVLWVLIWPISVILILLHSQPVSKHAYVSIVLMGLMLILIAVSYFRVNGTDIFIIQSVSMTVFLLFGLAAELILTQIGVLCYLASLRLTKDYHFRYPTNMLMFLVVSVGSAGFYYLIGGRIGMVGPGEPMQFPQIIGYAFAGFALNHVTSYIIGKVLYKESSFLDKSIIWELVTTLLTLPISFIFYILYSEYSVRSILMVAIPMLTLSVIFRLISRESLLSKQLKETNEIGRELSQTLEVKSVYKHFFKSLHSVLDISDTYLFVLDEAGGLSAVQHYDNHGEEGPINLDVFPRPDCSFYKNNRFKASTKKQWTPFLQSFLPDTVHSVMMLPLSMNDNLEGIIMLGSKLKYGYQKQHEMIFEIMTHFFSVALKNAANYEKTKMESERDPLTHLYNYRYFSQLLDSRFSAANSGSFAIIMLDLDHFKEINDQFGHESGNEILLQVAERLREAVKQDGVVARYGGEEFIILLDRTTSEGAYVFAESLRKKISNQSFMINPFNLDRHEMAIQVTASMGVATAPDQGKDSVTLIRNADRAMYAGAKQKGRNRVAAYSS